MKIWLSVTEDRPTGNLYHPRHWLQFALCLLLFDSGAFPFMLRPSVFFGGAKT
jgi:hypothetical protein